MVRSVLVTSQRGFVSRKDAHKMPLMEWDKKMSVGVALLDTDHQKLVKMLNDLYAAMVEGHGKDSLGKILDELTAYTKFTSHTRRISSRRRATRMRPATRRSTTSSRARWWRFRRNTRPA
jgi:hypothetical protein